MKIPEISELKQKKFHGSPGSQNAFYGCTKRIFDIVFAGLILILLSPFWLIIIFLIRLDSKGKAIFSHYRTGLNGKTFLLFKFRTMHQGVKNQEFAPQQANDPRITRIGRFLRKTSLDEIPQCINIIKGEMTFVGPRPEMKFITDNYNEIEKLRLMVKPGLTGLWQIYGRKDLPLHENVEYDLFYIENQSVKLDLYIIFKTAGVVLAGKGAY